MLTRTQAGWFALVMGGLVVGCAGGDADDDPAIGAGATGAAGGAGGTTGGAGGTTGGSGGTSGSSGRAGAGTGGQASGGTGGTPMSTGGTTGGSGAAAGQATTGGAGGRGTGGSQSAGMSGTSAAAGSGTGGSAGATPTSGCGVAAVPPSQKNSIMVEGTDVPREFIVAVPEDYDPNHPYRVVFAFHGLTGTAEQIAGNGFSGGYYGLASRIGDQTILVAPQGLAPEDEPDQYGWPNEGGRDIDFILDMVSWLSSNYCVDEARIFSVGFSYGGMISDTIGCELSDVFRGIAPIAGAVFGRASCADSPIAVWMAHGTADESVDFAQGENARDLFLEKNHCDTSLDALAVEPEGCVSYQGCDEGSPVTWCVHDGGHTVPNWVGPAVSDFFSQF